MSATPSRGSDHPAGAATAGPARVGFVLPASRRWAILAFTLAAGWSLFLLILAIFTVGRPVVAPGQVLKADVVVIGKQVAPQSDRLEVERVFKGNVATGDTLRVVNLSNATRIVSGKSFIFALRQRRKDFEITRLESQKPEIPPLVYPATPETIEQTKVILRDDPASIPPSEL